MGVKIFIFTKFIWRGKIAFMQIDKISSLDYITVHNILTSNKISEAQKVQFVRNNKSEISKIVEHHIAISGKDFSALMKNRPLIKFRPLKNSFTKRGDKILLAQTLGIEPVEVPDYIENIKDDMKEVDELKFLPKDEFDAIKTYVYRHGSKDDVIEFLDYELKNTKDILKSLYTTLEYHTGGVADYFIRPIHRFDNKTLVKIYNVIDKNLHEARANGKIEEEENLNIAKWALYRIYEIQNNNKFINAVKTYKTLKS